MYVRAAAQRHSCFCIQEMLYDRKFAHECYSYQTGEQVLKELVHQEAWKAPKTSENV
jgi:hypothetical protein